jgi:hypothetical protein
MTPRRPIPLVVLTVLAMVTKNDEEIAEKQGTLTSK